MHSCITIKKNAVWYNICAYALHQIIYVIHFFCSWSFGVTLWELVTVGGTPYGEILPEDLYAQLQNGMRMPCPTHCAQEV